MIAPVVLPDLPTVTRENPHGYDWHPILLLSFGKRWEGDQSVAFAN